MIVIGNPRTTMSALQFVHLLESWTHKESWANFRTNSFKSSFGRATLIDQRIRHARGFWYKSFQIPWFHLCLVWKRSAAPLSTRGSFIRLFLYVCWYIQSSYEILYPRDYLPTSNAAQSALIDKFVEGLERALHVKREEICRAELWKQDCPDGLDSSNIIEYLKFVGIWCTSCLLTQLLICPQAGCYPFFHDEYRAPEDFRNDHERKHGKPPFVHRYLNWQWWVHLIIWRQNSPDTAITGS